MQCYKLEYNLFQEIPAELEKLTEYLEHITAISREAIQSCSPNNDVSEKGLELYDECYDKSN